MADSQQAVLGFREQLKASLKKTPPASIDEVLLEKLALTIPCPSCKAAVGAECRWDSGQKRPRPHSARLVAIEATAHRWLDVVRVKEMLENDLPGSLRLLAAHLELGELRVKVSVSVAGGLAGDELRLVVDVKEKVG